MNATKILYLDDDFDSQEQMKEALLASGAKYVDCCFTVGEARQRLLNIKYDVLIVDEFLPLEMGHEFVKALGVERPNKVYILTGADTELLNRMLTSEGIKVDEVINKMEFFSRMNKEVV